MLASLRNEAGISRRGFTLIETLAAVTLLIVSIVSPMILTERSLTSAYYARDQITSFYLAQEAVEAIHQIRDNNILKIAKNLNSGVTLFDGVPVSSSCSGTQTYFTVDATQTNAANVIANVNCGTSASACPALQTSGGLYGYGSGWTNTNFTRSVYACYTDSSQNEVYLSVTVSWQTSALQARSFTLTENLYRWIQDGSGV